MKKIYYIVAMSYCGGRLGMSKTFDRFSDAQEYALKAVEDKDNTYITIDEIVRTGFFKKNYACKNIATYNEE